MSSEGLGTISILIGYLKHGDKAAIQPLWERYFEQLARLAHARLRRSPGAARTRKTQPGTQPSRPSTRFADWGRIVFRN